MWKIIVDGACCASGHEPINRFPSKSQSSAESPISSLFSSGLRSKQLTRVSISPTVSQTLAVMVISPSSGTGSGVLIGSIFGAILTTSIATTKVSELAPSSSVTSSVARCNPEVVYVCSIIEFCPILSNFISG